MLRAAFRLPGAWAELMKGELSKPYIEGLSNFIETAYKTSEVFPPREKIFAAFDITALEDVKVVILGQDPYHEPGQAQGLAFYVPSDVKKPPSLVNIEKELGKEVDLISWARQGVLLLNATLTVQAHKAASHKGHGWEEFTDSVISRLSEARENIVFILWGNNAQKKVSLIDEDRHLILKSAHPSPLSAYRGFFGSKPFSKANDYLISHGISPVEW